MGIKKSKKKARKVVKTRKAKRSVRKATPVKAEQNSLKTLLTVGPIPSRPSMSDAPEIAKYRRVRNIRIYLGSNASQDLVNRTFSLLSSVVPNFAFGQAVEAARSGEVTSATVEKYAKVVRDHYNARFPQV